MSLGPLLIGNVTFRNNPPRFSFGGHGSSSMSLLKRLAWMFLFACALALLASGASDPFAGTWLLNVAKSKLPSPAPESDTVRIELDPTNIKIDQDGTDEKGVRFKLTVLGGFDDSFYGVTGCTHFDSVSFRRTGSRRILGEVRKSGVVIESLDAEVSGNTLKVNLTAIDSSGKETKSLAILQRE